MRFSECVCLCGGKSSLLADRPVSPHKAWATIQAIQTRTLWKIPRKRNWRLNILEKTHTHTHTKEKPPKLFLCSRSVSAAIIGLSVLLTGNRGMLQLRQKNMKSVNYVAGGNAALVERHPLTSAESHFSTSSSLLYIWWQIFLPPKRLCEGYQGCLLNNHHVWKHHYETLTLCTALIKWLWLGRLNVRFGLIPEEGRKAEVLMDFGSSL